MLQNTKELDTYLLIEDNNVMKSILHITFSSVTDYFGEGLQIEQALANGFNVKILEINSLFHFTQSLHSEKYSNLVIKISSLNELEKIIKAHNPRDTIINVQFVYEWRFRKIFRLIAKNKKYHYSIFLLGQLPFNAKISLWKQILNAFPFKLLKRSFTVFISKILFKLNFLATQDVLFYAGENLKNNMNYKTKYPINYFDYDRFLESPESANEKIILFLDDALFQHPDDEIVGNINDSTTLYAYKESINRYFDYIENETGMNVIIASHPKVNHERNFFGNRKIVKFKTNELVQNASLILAHCSSSISFAVSYKKPIIFLTCNAINKYSKNNQPIETYIKNFSKVLKCPFFNIDDPYEPINLNKLDINNESYENFEISYLTTSETKNILSKDLIIQYFNNILKENKQ